MNKEKQFDCVKFKSELQEKLLIKSGAKNLREYVDFANKVAVATKPVTTAFPLTIVHHKLSRHTLNLCPCSIGAMFLKIVV